MRAGCRAQRGTENFEGEFDAFHGTEVIRQQGLAVYTLHYCGGIVR